MKPTADFKDRLLACLGGPWPDAPPLEAKELASEPVDSDVAGGPGVRRIKISYQTEPGEIVAAWLLIPDSATKDKPAPGICIWHQHNGAWHLGSSEPAGLAGMPMHHTGLALARAGYVVLCPDALGFGEREKGYKNKGGALERFLFLKYVVEGKCLAWKHILDMRRAVDLISSRPEVDATKLGCYGHSMGSTHTWLVGPWEPRLKALVGNCCLPTYAGIHRTQILHCFPNFIPGLYQYGDTPDIAALIAPRALHLNLGDQDGGTPLAEAKEGIARIEKAYQAAHAEKNFSYFIEENTGHVLSPKMWERVQAFFAKHLRS